MSDWDPSAPYPTEAVSTKATILNLDKVAVQLPIGMQRAKMTIEDQYFFAEEAIVRLTGFVMSEHLAADTVTESEEVPDTWWDHLKDNLMAWARKKGVRWTRPLRWWFRRRPPHYRQLTLTATWTRKATRPMSTITVRDNPALGAVIYQEDVSKGIWWSK